MILKDYYGIYHEIKLKPDEEANFIKAGKWQGGIVDLFKKEKEKTENGTNRKTAL